jgi:polyphosphate kinase
MDPCSLTDDSFFDRDLSWLSFNDRILDEAAKKTVPLNERFRFLAIFSSNLDEFYRVRFPVLLAAKQIIQKKDNINLLHLPDADHATDIILLQQEKFGRILVNELLPELNHHNIQLVYNQPIPDTEKAIVTEYFYSQVLAFLQPVYLSKKKFYATNNSIYFLVVLNNGTNKEKLVVLNIPSDQLPRFFSININGRQVIVFLEDVIRDNLHGLFKDEKVVDCYTFKITRDAEIELKDEFPRDIARQFENQLKKRDFGFATRFLYQPGLPLRILELLVDKFELENTTMVEGGVYHNLKELFALPLTNKELCFEPWPAITYKDIKTPDIFYHIAAKDILFSPPYQSYNTILRFFNEAAADVVVKEIFVTLYRVAANSRIVNALMSAAKSGKKVVVMIELKARFDEANNLKWAKKLKAAGATILYSVTALKVHAKLALVKREEDGRLKYYGLLGTGNFNEETAKLYTDHILMTANPKILAEVELLFLFLAKRVKPEKHDPINFTYLLVAKFNLQERFIALIDHEIRNAKQGLSCGITIKLNNIEDRKLIAKLYEASAAGVPVNLIIRGVCCLIPGIKGMSENITVKRIVDRYLEHARVFIFNNNNQPVVYAGSADWMNRNIYRRIEVCFPVLDGDVKQELIDIINLQLQDNIQAVMINSNLENSEIKSADKGMPAQLAIYEMLKNK